ncbi:MAG TPA: A/G-specific adenine glycosylase, partial [Solidesulfovibrio sp.]|nr:A/G-specific adenine glycosylase [Solidesulfovibrio sp.]
MSDASAFVPLLLDWFAANKRDLPWRRCRDPYAVWVSEIMAQQTQMDRVVVYFNRFMDRFPDVAALAAANEDAVLKAWE